MASDSATQVPSQQSVKAYVAGNVVVDAYTATTTISTLMPRDATVPQNTEGTEILSASITPRATTSRVKITVSATSGETSGADTNVIFAVFKDSDADAIHAAQLLNSGNATNNLGGVVVVYVDSPATTSAITYTVRVGPHTGTLNLNTLYGTAGGTRLILEEIL